MAHVGDVVEHEGQDAEEHGELDLRREQDERDGEPREYAQRRLEHDVVPAAAGRRRAGA